MEYGNFDYGNWQNMPNPNEGYVNPHQSGIARLGRMLDPTSHIVSAIGGNDAPQVHDVLEKVADYSNEAISPVMGFVMQGEETLNPYIKEINKSQGTGLRNFVKNKPVDTAAILAASFFGGGAAAAGAGSGGTAAAGTLGAAGQTAANAAITGASTTGAASGLGAAGSAAVTPAFASGLGATTVTAPGVLGATGTAALNAAIPSTFPALSASTPGAGQSLLNMYNAKVKPIKSKVGKAWDVYSNFSDFAGDDPNEARRKQIEDQLIQGISGVNNGY